VSSFISAVFFFLCYEKQQETMKIIAKKGAWVASQEALF